MICRAIEAPMTRGLSADEMRALAPYIATADLTRAVLHCGTVPWYLPKRFSAIVRGHHIFFRPGVYDPHTVAGIALLGHELTHVGQYRMGMSAARYLCSVIGGYHNSRYEKAAFAMQARILNDLTI
jgi:Domain of unknown function (DUF4157)